jgi:hypothetical protein
MKGLALGSAGALLAFAVNSSFHNLLDSTLTLWLLAGFSAALANIAATRPGVLPESLEVTRSTTPGRAGTRQKGSLRPSFGED